MSDYDREVQRIERKLEQLASKKEDMEQETKEQQEVLREAEERIEELRNAERKLIEEKRRLGAITGNMARIEREISDLNRQKAKVLSRIK